MSTLEGKKKKREQEQKAEGKMMICTAQRAKADLILINNAISIIYLISLFLARCLTNLFWSLLPYLLNCLLFLLCSKIHHLYCKRYLWMKETDGKALTLLQTVKDPGELPSFASLTACQQKTRTCIPLSRTSSFSWKSWTQQRRQWHCASASLRRVQMIREQSKE